MADRRERCPVAGALGGGAFMAMLVAGTAFAADESVAIAGFAFDPAAVTVSVGDSVTWTNGDGVGHTATADDASFDTGSIGAGGSDSVTFSTAGTFAYHCTIHPAMTGTVTVQAATGGGGSTATTPPTDVAQVRRGSSGDFGAGWIGLLVPVVSWVTGLAVVLQRLKRQNLATQSWADSSAGDSGSQDSRMRRR